MMMVGWLHREHTWRVHVHINDGCGSPRKHDKWCNGIGPGASRRGAVSVPGHETAKADGWTDRWQSVSPCHELREYILGFGGALLGVDWFRWVFSLYINRVELWALPLAVLSAWFRCTSWIRSPSPKNWCWANRLKVPLRHRVKLRKWYIDYIPPRATRDECKIIKLIDQETQNRTNVSYISSHFHMCIYLFS